MNVSLLITASIVLALAHVATSQAQTMNEPMNVQIRVRADQPGGMIPREIYGHFAEHLGRCIYEGIWVGEDSTIPNTRGIRNDVLAALKNLNIPVLRWPGGCFADEYHWRDGIGPRDKRPKTINTHWGMVIENNHFGTHEFFDLCELLGAEAYIAGNVGSGTPQEMMEWVEYMTSDSDSTLANLRRQNGRNKPWRVNFFGVGNENWGCGGNMRPEYYADVYRRFQTFVKNYPGNKVSKIACGSSGEDLNWTEVLMERAGKHMHGLSLHWYTLPTGNWSKKGAATGFPREQWHSTLVKTWRLDELITRHSAIMDKHDPQRKVGLIVDEWGTWYDHDPAGPSSALYQQNTIRDAVAAGINFHIFHKHTDRVTMATIAQTVNVLQAVILTDKDRMILTPTYHVFEMFKVHQGAMGLPTEIDAPAYEEADKSVPTVSASASRDAAGKTHLSIVNAHLDRPASVTIQLQGLSPRKVSARALTAEKMDAHNTFDQPQNVQPVSLEGIQIDKERITVALPARSVTVVELE